MTSIMITPPLGPEKLTVTENMSCQNTAAKSKTNITSPLVKFRD